MAATIIDGKSFAATLTARVADEVSRLKASHGFTPGLAVVIVGDDPASEIYVRSKRKRTVEVGMASFHHALAADTSEADLLALVAELGANDDVDGILVQLPVPPQIDPQKVIAAIDPDKDVDGLSPVSVGRLAIGIAGPVPCTPLGCLLLLRDTIDTLEGLNALVIGRSNLVGKPLAQLMLRDNATVTIAHSRTRDLPALARGADILVAAVGRPEFVRGDWVKPGATVIDVGVNRLPPVEEGGRPRLVGDVAFAEAVEVAGAITPVPGGVGPMTIACLMANTITAACRRRGLEPPAGLGA